MSNAKTLHLQFADGEIEVGTLIDALYEQERTIAILRQHKTDYMEAAEGTRKALEAECERLRGEISDLHTTMMAAAVEIQEHWAAHCDEGGYGPTNLMHRLEKGIAAQYGYTSQVLFQLKAERDTLRQQRDKLAQVLENVEREHDLIRRMKNCELHRGRGSFGIAVMSDTHAIEWQALDKELQQLIDARRAALAEIKP